MVSDWSEKMIRMLCFSVVDSKYLSDSYAKRHVAFCGCFKMSAFIAYFSMCRLQSSDTFFHFWKISSNCFKCLRSCFYLNLGANVSIYSVGIIEDRDQPSFQMQYNNIKKKKTFIVR